MGNDIAAHRAAIGLFYCKTNGISLKNCVFVKFCFRDVFSNMANFFRNIFKYVHAMALINYDVIVITLLVIHLLLLSALDQYGRSPFRSGNNSKFSTIQTVFWKK